VALEGLIWRWADDVHVAASSLAGFLSFLPGRHDDRVDAIGRVG